MCCFVNIDAIINGWTRINESWLLRFLHNMIIILVSFVCVGKYVRDFTKNIKFTQYSESWAVQIYLILLKKPSLRSYWFGVELWSMEILRGKYYKWWRGEDYFSMSSRMMVKQRDVAPSSIFASLWFIVRTTEYGWNSGLTFALFKQHTHTYTRQTMYNVYPFQTYIKSLFNT